MGIDYTFDMILSEDGSGRGAALVAAVLQGKNETQPLHKNQNFCTIM